MINTDDFKILKQIAARYRALCIQLDMPDPEAIEIAARVHAWHRNVEPLRLDLLLASPDVDFAHDVGGIMREDKLQSARSALCYHPRATT